MEMIRAEREAMMMRVWKDEEGVSTSGDERGGEDVEEEEEEEGREGQKREENGGGKEGGAEMKKKKKKKKKRRTVEHGNYGAYYGYRLMENGKDPRMELFKSEWCVCARVICRSDHLSSLVGEEIARRETLTRQSLQCTHVLHPHVVCVCSAMVVAVTVCFIRTGYRGDVYSILAAMRGRCH